MKRNILLTSIILCITSFLCGLPLFNEISINRIANYLGSYERDGLESSMIQVESNDAILDISVSEFNNYLNEAAVKNNLLIARYLYTQDSDSGQNILRLYITTNDYHLSEWLLLEGDKASNINKNVIYSSSSTDTSEKILTFFDKYIYEITSIENNISNEGSYVIFNLSGDFNNNFSNFIRDLNDEFGYISYKNDTSLLVTSKLGDLDGLSTILNLPLIKIGIVIITTFIICSNILINRKKISILKLEGFSDLAIFNKEYFVYHLICFALSILAVWIICAVFLYGNTNTLSILVSLFLIEAGQMLILQFLFSILVYLIIKYIPIVESVKGYQNLSQIQAIAYGFKAIALIMILPIVSSSFSSITNLYTITKRYTHVNSKLSNVYGFGGIRNSNYVIGSSEAIDLKNDLSNSLFLFEMSGGMYWDEGTIPSAFEIDHYIIDETFANKMDLVDETFNSEEAYIWLPSKSDYDKDYLLEKVKDYYTNPPKINIGYYDKTIETYNLNEILFNDNAKLLPIIYTPAEDGYKGQLNDSYFIFDGNISKAQDYIDSKFKEHGFSPYFTIKSLRSSYNYLYNNYVNSYTKNILQFLILLIALILTNVFLIRIDYENNKKKYFVTYIEGMKPYNLISYFIRFSSITLFSFILLLLSKRVSISDILYVLVFIFCFEAISYTLFLLMERKMRKTI